MNNNVDNWNDGLRLPEDPNGWNFTYDLAEGITVTRGDKIHVRGPHTVVLLDAIFVCQKVHNFAGDVENNRFWIKWSALNPRHNNLYEMIHPRRLRKVFTQFRYTLEKLDGGWVNTMHDMTLRNTRVINYCQDDEDNSEEE